MIKDGYTNVNGVLVENNLDIKSEPCPQCGCQDCEVVRDLLFEPPQYRLKCADPACGYVVPEEYAKYEEFRDDGVEAAVDMWNMLALAAKVEKEEKLIEVDGKLVDTETAEIIR